MSHHSVVDRQHQASVELLVLSHIGRRKRSVKLKKKPPDLQPVVPLELGCMYALCNRHLPYAQSFVASYSPGYAAGVRHSKNLGGRESSGALAVTRGVTRVASGACKRTWIQRLPRMGVHRKALSIGE